LNTIKVIQTKHVFNVYSYQVIKEQRQGNRAKCEIIYTGFSYIKALKAGHQARTKNYPLFEFIGA
jgi:hypothetical protein